MAESETKNINSLCQIIDNPFLCVYINDYIRKFRSYNEDEFVITISGLTCFISQDDTILNFLFEQLKQNKFTIETVGDEKSINDIAALIFEVIVSCNRNRQLWSNDESRRGHIRTMTCLYFFGPTYTFIQEPSQGIIAETYSDAKVKLEDAYKKSFNPFFP